MKISLNWLKNHIELSETPEQISELLTNCGLEVEHLYPSEDILGGLRGLVVGHVLEVAQHPNAERLSLTKVDIGDRILSIVCGAPNVAKGQKVIVAPIGTTIYNTAGEPLVMKKAKIRGEESEGMICAEDEIGIGMSHDGIVVLESDCKVGSSLANYYNIESDWIFEIGLTPNRGDAASHLGIARDLKAILNRSINPVNHKKTEGKTIKFPLEINIENAECCRRYSGVCIQGINVSQSPEWLQKKLKAIGINPINTVVDLTNYIMHDIGQPMHAFDLDKIKGKISVRYAIKNETLTTLDKTDRKFTGEELIIADENGPLALAGVIGGIGSAITSTTSRIFIESAWFNAANVRKNAKLHALSTDASFRFERGIDPHSTRMALHRMIQLIMEIADGKEVSDLCDIIQGNIDCHKVNFNLNKFETLAGIKIEAAKLKTILQNLDIAIESEDKEGWRLAIPNYRADVTRDIDVFEDILRIYGYNNIPFPEIMHSAAVNQPKPDKYALKQTISNYLSAQGFNEIATNSLTNAVNYDSEELKKAIKLLNPLSSELSVMRMSFLPSMLEAIAYNKNRKASDLKFYEFGNVYLQSESGFKEIEKLCIMVCGHKEDIGWNQKPIKIDYFYLKSIATNALSTVGASKIKSLEINEIALEILQKFNIKGKVWAVEVNFESIISAHLKNKFTLNEIPVFPEVSRDLNLILNKDIKYSEIELIVSQTLGSFLRKLTLVDVYEGKPLLEGQKSYTINMLMYDTEKTMTDTQIDQLMQKLMATFETKLKAFIRKSVS